MLVHREFYQSCRGCCMPVRLSSPPFCCMSQNHSHVDVTRTYALVVGLIVNCNRQQDENWVWVLVLSGLRLCSFFSSCALKSIISPSHDSSLASRARECQRNVTKKTAGYSSPGCSASRNRTLHHRTHRVARGPRGQVNIERRARAATMIAPAMSLYPEGALRAHSSSRTELV